MSRWPRGLTFAAQPRSDSSSSADPPDLSHSAGGQPILGPGKSWTPLNRALARFYNHADRFASERRMRILAGSLDRLRSALLAAGANLEACLSPNFSGSSPAPEHESVLRSDQCFEVRRAGWAETKPDTVTLGRQAFSGAWCDWLGSQGPLSLVELDCLGITASPRRAAITPGQEGNLLTQIRFELAAQPHPGDDGGRAGWQASGEWELEWERVDAGAGATPDGTASDSWRVVAWRPREMITVRALTTAFTDVTRDAFGEDPTYSSHLLRDTNYWRAVLDEASGIDIFGNCGVSVGDADGDGQDEIYLCQPQGLPNRLYRQVRPGVFEDVAARAGVDLLDPTSMALFADVLNRGHQDLVLITESSPLLFLNDGHGRFTLARDAFPSAGGQVSLTSAALGDYNNDGYLDLYVCAYAYFQGQGISGIPVPYYDAHNGPPNRLYRNRGDGTFEDVTAASGLNHGNDRFSFACAWCDIDDDGWPDLAVVNDFGRNNLYRNRRDGTFEEVEDGLPGHGAGMSAAFVDTGGGAPDLYVGNMWQPAGVRVTADPEFQRRFADVAPDAVRQFAMGNALYEHRGAQRSPNGSEESVSRAGYSPVPGAAGADRGRWAWCCEGFDLENDGHLDLYAVNGFLSSPTPERDPLDAYLWQEIIALSPHSAGVLDSEYRAAWNAGFHLAHHGHPWNGNERDVFFLNLGASHAPDALRFADASAVTRLDSLDDGRAFAVFDYDGDGDADLIVHSRTGPQLRLLRNDVAALNHSLAIRLRGTTGNRDAIGARIELVTPSGRQVRYLSCGSGFLAQHSKELVLGLGQQSSATSLRVRWPGGKASEYENLEAGYRYVLVEGKLGSEREPLKSAGVALNSGGSQHPARTPEPSHDGATAPPDPVPPAPPVAEAVPARFSTTLVDPLPVPPLEPLREIAEARRDRVPHGQYALLWLWNPGDSGGLETFARVESQVPSRLVLWDAASAESAALPKTLQSPPWRADERFRVFASTLLAYLFDHRREPTLPTGLLFDFAGKASAPAQSTGGAPVAQAQLVKIYWGGADAGEILGDVRLGIKPGASALPFSGRPALCSFRRDPRELGAALATAQLHAEAEVYLADAAAMHPADPDTLYNLALVERETGKADRALSNVRAALAARPVFPEAENLCAVLLGQAGDPAGAQAYLERATREVPNFVEAWNNLGYVLLTKGDLAASRTALERALTLAPDFPDALDNLGIVSARQGDLTRAEELFRRVLAIYPDSSQAANNLGVLYARQGKTGLALATLGAAFKRNPDDASSLFNLARLNLSLHRSADAAALLEGWLTRHPGDAIALKLLQQAQGKP